MQVRCRVLATALVLMAAADARAAVGSAICAPCHATIHEHYSATPMALSSGPVGTGMLRESFRAATFTAGAAQYQVSADGLGFAFSFRQGDIAGRRSLDYFIGSGAVGRSYASLLDGFLFQAPVAYYSAAGRWDVSPGYERSPDLHLTRAVEPGCLRCHASGVRHQEGTHNGYAAPPFAEGGVSCERCHGAGEEHVAAMRSGRRGAAPGIVNPARLAPARRDSVCAQCHLSGATEIVKAGAARAYAPGDLLADSTATFVWSGAEIPRPVISHFERMTQSACRGGAPDRFWCGTCHDPHTVPAAADRDVYYRRRCFQCHTATSCKETPAARATAQNSCITCHMPRSPVRSVQHAAYTDHAVPRRPVADSAAAVPRDATLTLFGGGVASDRDLGLAYADVALRENNRAWGSRAFALLQKALAQTPGDAKVASQLAQLYDRTGNEQRACELYAQAVAAAPAALVPAANLGACLAKQGDLPAAVRRWQEVLARHPSLESARINLAVALLQSGDGAAASGTLEQALRLNPASRRAKAMLEQVRATGR